MKLKEVGILIKILSGKTCGMCMIGMDLEDDLELSSPIQQIVKEDLISVEVERVECIQNKEDYIVRLHCSIDEDKKAELILNYEVEPKKFVPLNDFYKKFKTPKRTNNNNMAIMLVKDIIESYDPLIQIQVK